MIELLRVMSGLALPRYYARVKENGRAAQSFDCAPEFGSSQAGQNKQQKWNSEVQPPLLLDASARGACSEYSRVHAARSTVCMQNSIPTATTATANTRETCNKDQTLESIA